MKAASATRPHCRKCGRRIDEGAWVESSIGAQCYDCWPGRGLVRGVYP